ncbi:hypothetical protein IE53DRAFT_34076 [Violaceomyces palustris]|uniref:Uncharacterized protein n=1 Tax=Violaceomyces palustris TaxID=1673888 RepID=A0ACD0P1H7_9BASI|nr:hypothetical protein IE53DRAFT_34076 [Violaceomyces palustris]
MKAPSKLVRLKRDQGASNCAPCTNIAPCPTCSNGQVCVQTFRSSCDTCPVNKCIADENASSNSGVSSGGGGSSSKSSLGAAIGGVAGAAIVAVVLYFLWRRAKKLGGFTSAARQRSAEKRNLELETRRREKGQVTVQLNSISRGDDGKKNEDEDSQHGWTEFRTEIGIIGDLGDPNCIVTKRRSFGGATHLSRITEGVEEEEEELTQEHEYGLDDYNYPNVINRKVYSKSSSINLAVGNGSGSFRASTSSVGSRVSGSSASTNLIPITFKPSPLSKEITCHSSAPSRPEAAHRAVGAPHVDITGVHSPLRPTRAPDLNLRLADGTEPGRRLSSSTKSSLSGSTGSRSLGSPLTQHEALLSPVPSSSISSDRRLDFMSIDPTVELQGTKVYTRQNRPLSTGTTHTFNSVSTAGIDYVMSAPTIVTPVTADGARRVQLNQGKPMLVRNLSQLRKEREAAAASAGGSVKSPLTSPNDSTTTDPFSDSAAIQTGAHADNLGGGIDVDELRRESIISASSLGIPFGSNPRLGPSDPGGHSPVDADRSSWLGGATRAPESIQGGSEHIMANCRSFSDLTRQSQASSIGGLSVFDGIPFKVSSTTEENFPSDAAMRIAAINSRCSVTSERDDGNEGDENDRDRMKHPDTPTGPECRW